MISFKQYLEFHVSNGWCPFSVEFLKLLTDEELSLVHIEYPTWKGVCQLWYPKDEWTKRQDRVKQYKLLDEVHKIRLAQIELEVLNKEIFPADLPTMKQLIEKMIAAELKNDFAEVRKLEQLMAQRARKDSRDESK